MPSRRGPRRGGGGRDDATAPALRATPGPPPGTTDAAGAQLWHSARLAAACPLRRLSRSRPLALKSTIYKASLQIADIDRAVYASPTLTLALHPSETEERLMVRLLAYALQRPASDEDGALEFARGLSDSDEPDLWQRDLTGALVHWIEVGQPDERRLAKACARASRVTLYAYSSATPVWWAGLSGKVSRLANLAVWRIDAAQSQDMARLAARSMQLQVNVQDGAVWLGGGDHMVEIHPTALQRPR